MKHQQKLNRPATEIFCLLLGTLHNSTTVTLQADDLLLTLEFVDPLPKDPHNAIGIFRLFQDSANSNDGIPHIDMTFHVTDRRKRPKDFALVKITPMAFQCGSLAIYLPHPGETSQTHPDSLVRILRKWLANFAEDWMGLIGRLHFPQATPPEHVGPPCTRT